ncbi:HAD-like protein [Dendrothele bispora CBS 962.96]|uniref:HAD-like protein n=1 Tax=Dendrothele bispora (strain CBS 962.96) TaxID=1314807 RepID=A0A4S8L8Y7_DENBC|nr:HAD-like protein [Dendrothele bispora CBS 962.96]
MNPTIDTLFFDLGDVLFTWSPSTQLPSVPPKTLRKILESATWFEYEKGNLSEDACYAAVATEFCVSPDHVREAFQAARDTLTSRPFMVDLIRQLKPGRKVYAMSNISAPDWLVLSKKDADWSIFDGVFTSASVGERKPNIGIYRHVLETTGADPAKSIFVDDKLENVLVARSFGIHGIVYDSFENVQRSLLNLCFDPIARAQSFLSNHKLNHLSYTNTGVTIQENFAQLLILEATGDPSLVDYTKYDGQFNFFRGPGELTTSNFPCDVDTTSIGLTIVPHVSPATKHCIMDDILQLRNSDGIVQVYFDSSRPRIDPVVCVNVLTLFHENGRGEELKETFDWVENVLKHRAYEAGTRYYEPAEAFLFFLSRLLSISPQACRILGSLFVQRVRERIGLKGDALALAMRILCAFTVSSLNLSQPLNVSADVHTLMGMQEMDGGWADGWMYKYGASGVLIANRGFTTALSVNALKEFKELETRTSKNVGIFKEKPIVAKSISVPVSSTSIVQKGMSRWIEFITFIIGVDR